MGTRMTAAVLGFMLLAVAAVGVAMAATEDGWETVAVGAVWERRMVASEIEHPTAEVSLASETKRNPQLIRIAITSKNEKVKRVPVWITVECENPVFNGDIKVQYLQQMLWLPADYTFDTSEGGDAGQCMVAALVRNDFEYAGKIRVKVSATY